MSYFGSLVSRRQVLGRLLSGVAGAALALPARAAPGPAVALPAASGLAALRDGVLIAARAVGNRLWVADNRGHLLSSDDGGTNWRVLGAAAPGALTSIAFGAGPAQRLGVAVGHRRAVRRSVDGGQTWLAAALPTQDAVTLLDAVVLSATQILAVGAFGACWGSNDAGASWKRLSPSKGDRHYNACAANAQGQVVIVGEAGLILRSADGGQSWAEVNTPNKASLFAVATTSAGHFVAAGLGGVVLSSSDGGAQWAVHSAAQRQSWLGVTALDDGSVLLAGSGGALSHWAHDSASGNWSPVKQVREGYGAWCALLPCTPVGGAPALLAVGEIGVRRLDRAAWVMPVGAAL